MKSQWIYKIFSAVLIVMLALAALPVSPAYAADTGFIVPSACASGGGQWATTGNAAASDNSYTTSNNGGEVLTCTFATMPAIPAGQQIDGIEVEVEGQTSGRDINVDLTWNAGTTFTTTVGLNFGAAPDQTLTAGAINNTWGRTWAASEFTAANFRVRITSTGGGGTFSLDRVRVRVTYTPDVTAPAFTSITRQTPATSPTNANTLIFRATFSESVQNVSAADFVVTGTTATITGVATINASTYDITVSGGNLAGLNGTVGLNLAGGQNIQDLASNSLPNTEPATDETYVVDNTVPSVVSLVIQNPATSPTNANTLIFRVTFNEDVTNVSTGDFDVTGTTGNVTAVTTVTANTVFDITVSGGNLATLNATVTLSFDTTGMGQQDITDTTGNALPNPSNTASYVVDNTAPTATITQATGQTDPTSTQPINFQVTFNEAINISSFVSTDINNGGTAPGTKTVTITEIAPNNGTTFNVAISGLTGSGTVTISLGTNTFQDAAGNNNSAASTNTDNSVTYNAITVPTLSITNSPVTYNGSPQAANVTCSSGGAVSNVLYDGSSTVPTNSGTYAVTANCAAVSGFTSLTNASAGNFVINPSTPTASITNSPVTYNGSAQTATVACSGGGTATLASGGTGTNAGSYPATVNCAASANYNAATGLAAGNFVINPATPTASITNSPVTYNGSAQTATVACSGGGAATLATGGTGTNAGSYPATVDCAASANYNAATGLAAGNFVINPATQTLTVTNGPVDFDGSAHAATVACSGGGASSNILTGGAATQTDAGTYTVTADCAATTNYGAATGLTAGNSFIINQINPTASVTNSPQNYTGTPQSALVACLGGGASSNILTGGAATQTDAGIYAVTGDCAASTNYTAATGLSAGNFVINPITPTATVTNSPQNYTGAPQSALVLCAGGGAASNILTGGSATQTDAGTYAVTVDCAASTNYTAATGLSAGNFVINSIGQTINVTTSAPSSAANGSTFNVAATATSGLPVTITVSGVCSVADVDGSTTDGDATVTMTSGTGTCSLFYNQAGDSNYTAAPQVQEDVTATESPVFTSADNTSFDLGFISTFNITATGNPSTMTISVTGTLPSGITFTDNGDGTASFSGTPGTAGVYPLVLTANNGVNPNGTQNFTLTVRNGPVVGVVNSNPDTGNGSISENESILNTLNIIQLFVTFDRDVYDPAGDTDLDDVTNPANYILVRSATGTFATVDCAGGVVAPDVNISVDSVTYNNTTFTATLNINGGLPINVNGFYRLYVCGTTSIVDATNPLLTLAGDGVNPNTDFTRTFQITAPAPSGGGGGSNPSTTNLSGVLIPATGFTPNQVTKLPAQSVGNAYVASKLSIEIPSLSMNLPIVGIALKDKQFNVTWLGNNAGYLEGSAYPTWQGNSILTGHVTDANGKPGPFAYVNELKTGDQIYIHNNGFTYVYEVRESKLVLPNKINDLFKHQEDYWLTLVTCENFNAKSETFTHRRIVRAVLISIIPQK